MGGGRQDEVVVVTRNGSFPLQENHEPQWAMTSLVGGRCDHLRASVRERQNEGQKVVAMASDGQ